MSALLELPPDPLRSGGTGMQRIAPSLRGIVLELDLESGASMLRLRGTFPAGVAGGWQVHWIVERFEELGLVRISIVGRAPLSAERFDWSKQPFDVRVPLPRMGHRRVPYDVVVSTLKSRALAHIPWTPLA